MIVTLRTDAVRPPDLDILYYSDDWISPRECSQVPVVEVLGSSLQETHAAISFEQVHKLLWLMMKNLYCLLHEAMLPISLHFPFRFRRPTFMYFAFFLLFGSQLLSAIPSCIIVFSCISFSLSTDRSDLPSARLFCNRLIQRSASMPVSSGGMPDRLPGHPSPLDNRRAQAERTVPHPSHLGLSAGSSAWQSPAAATRSKLDHSLRSSNRPSAFGCSSPSPLSLVSQTSHSSTSPSNSLLTSGPQRSVHRVTAATEQHEYYPSCLPTETHSCRGEGISNFHPSSNIPCGSPMSPLTRIVSSSPKGSATMWPRDGLRNKHTSYSSHCSPSSVSVSESQNGSLRQLNGPDSTLVQSLPSCPMASQTPIRSTGIINKSIQSILRRGKTKQAKLSGSPSLPSLNVNSKSTGEPRAHKINSAQSLTKAAVLSSAYAFSEPLPSCRSSSSIQSFHPSLRSPVVRNGCAAEQESLPSCSISDSSLKSARSFTSTLDSDSSYSPLATPTFPHTASCLPGDHSKSSVTSTAIFTGSLSVSDIGLAGDHSCVKVSMSHSAETLAPAIEVTEESDEDDSEVEDIVANLRSIAASRNPKGQHWGSDSQSSLRRNSVALSINSDQYSVDSSDALSICSFDTTMDEEDEPDYFPLPSWPALSSTSQSPVQVQPSSAPR